MTVVSQTFSAFSYCTNISANPPPIGFVSSSGTFDINIYNCSVSHSTVDESNLEFSAQ